MCIPSRQCRPVCRFEVVSMMAECAGYFWENEVCLTVGTMVQQMTVQMRTKRVSVLSQASQAARTGDTAISGILKVCLADRLEF